MSDTHHHGHDHAGRSHPAAQALEPDASPLRASAAARLGVVAVVLAALWAAVFWAMS